MATATAKHAETKIYSEPDGSRVGWIRGGRSVTVLGGVKGWSKVEVHGGDQGGKVVWMKNSDLDID